MIILRYTTKGYIESKRIKDKRKNGLVGPNFAFGRNGAI